MKHFLAVMLYVLSVLPCFAQFESNRHGCATTDNVPVNHPPPYKTINTVDYGAPPLNDVVRVALIFVKFKNEDRNGHDTGNENWKATNIKIYRASTNGGSSWNLSNVLEATPPSKPMGIKEEECVFSNGHFRPKISWEHNIEPDMVRGGGLLPENKRYKIYRSVSADMSSVPPDAFRNPENVYSHIATVDIPPNVNPTFTDDEIISGCALPDGPCPPNCWILYPVRYRVQAVDKFDDVSVLSDFAHTTAIRTVSGDPGGEEEGGDQPGYDGQVPTVFDLQQNYPNPFNPTTNIQYDIPNDVFVSIKIYDMLGREVSELVNEFKNAGRYIEGFNGSKLSSGIYYYKIKAGSFEQTRRMVLIK